MTDQPQQTVVEYMAQAPKGNHEPAEEPACDAYAHLCMCHLPAGHDGPHSCPPSECTGQWFGSNMDDPEFRPVTMPQPVAFGTEAVR